jgi:predicted alternative tryptophan synthase beta-subunit
VACETLVTTGMAMVAGEITTETYVDIPELVRDTLAGSGTPTPIRHRRPHLRGADEHRPAVAPTSRWV